MNTRKMFYQNDDVHTVIARDRDSTILRAGFSVLAQHDSEAASQSRLLLGSDQQDSPILEFVEAHPCPAAYTPYGVRGTLRSWIGFTGAARDAFLAGYMLGNGYRLYNPTLMRFCSPDSLSPFIMTNSYVYCAGDPVNSSDHSGHMPRRNLPPNGWVRREQRYNPMGMAQRAHEEFSPTNMGSSLTSHVWSRSTSSVPHPFSVLSPNDQLRPLDLSARSTVSTDQASPLDLSASLVSLTPPRAPRPVSPLVASGPSANLHAPNSIMGSRQLVHMREQEKIAVLMRSSVKVHKMPGPDFDKVVDSRKAATEAFYNLPDGTRFTDHRIYLNVSEELRENARKWLTRAVKRVRDQ